MIDDTYTFTDLDMHITALDRDIEIARRQEEEEEKQAAKERNMSFGQILKSNKARYDLVYNTQLYTFKRMFGKDYDKELFKEYWNLLLEDKATSINKFLESKGIEKPVHTSVSLEDKGKESKKEVSL